MDLSISITIGYATGLTNFSPRPTTATEEPAASPPVAAPVEETESDEAPHRAEHRHHHGRHGRHGRRHMQRTARHILRDVRHEMRDEIKELRAGGEDEKADAVRSAYRDFKDEIRGVFKEAGRGHHFDRGAVVDGLGAAMASFTAALRALNGEEEETAVAAVVDDLPAIPAPGADDDKGSTPDLPAGSLLDINA